jgi:hypothetical protein
MVVGMAGAPSRHDLDTASIPRFAKVCNGEVGETHRQIIVFPAKAGTHASAVSGADKWVPAFAGTTKKNN